jgi:hypothetical protein
LSAPGITNRNLLDLKGNFAALRGALGTTGFFRRDAELAEQVSESFRLNRKHRRMITLIYEIINNNPALPDFSTANYLRIKKRPASGFSRRTFQQRMTDRNARKLLCRPHW